MELEELKSAWQKSKEQLQDNDITNDIVINQVPWITRNRNVIESFICLVAAIFISVILILAMQKNDTINEKNLIIYIVGFIIALYTFVKGLFTLIFTIKQRKFDDFVNNFSLSVVKNQLYFVYERMLWLWIFIPLILTALPFVFVEFITITENMETIYCITSGILYITALIIFSKMLLRKMKQLLLEEKEILNNSSCQE